MGLFVAPAPAGAPVPPPPTRGERFRDWAGEKAADGLIALFIKLPFALIAAAAVFAFGCCYFTINQTLQGRFRYHIRPVWVAALAAYVAWWTPLAWLAVGFLLDLWPQPWRWASEHPRRRIRWPLAVATSPVRLPVRLAVWLRRRRDPEAADRRWISDRERRIIARGCGIAAGWQVLAPALCPDWRWTAGSLTAAAVTACWPWWQGRRVRDVEPEPEVGPHELEVAWGELVASSERAGDLTGSILTVDPDDEGRGHLRALPGALSANVIAAADLACSLLGRQRGTVTISEDTDEEASALDFLVGFPSRVRTAEVRYWRAPVVDDTFTWDVADSLDGRSLLTAIAQRGGTINIIVIARSGAGKGSILRQVGVVAARHPKVFLAINDCKGEDEGGAGVPELRRGADAYGRTADQWRAIACMKIEIYSARASRYGNAGKNFWHPNQLVDGYADPLFCHMTDEFNQFVETHPEMREAWETMAARQRSLGMQDTISTQRGTGADLATTNARNNLRGNGVVFIGPAGDTTSENIATSDFGVALKKLPVGQGWFYVQSKVLQIASVPARVRVIPTEDEVLHLGFSAPHGTVEEWLAPEMVHFGAESLHPQDRDIYEKWRPEFTEPIPGEVIAEHDERPAATPGDEREVIQVGDGVSVERPPLLALVRTPVPVPTTEDRVIDLLRTRGPMTRRAIAAELALSEGHTSGLLKVLAKKKVVESTKISGSRYPVWTLRSAA